MGLRTTLSCQAKLLAGSRGTSAWNIGFPCMSIFPCRSRSTRAHITVTARIDIPACTEKHLWAPVICFLLSLTPAPCCTGKLCHLPTSPAQHTPQERVPSWEQQDSLGKPTPVPNCCAKWHKCRWRLRCVAGCDTARGPQSPPELGSLCFPGCCCFQQTRVGELGP